MTSRTLAVSNETKRNTSPLLFINKGTRKDAVMPLNNLSHLSYSYDALGSTFRKIQPKLEINQPGDKYEQEADAMADKVMRMQEPTTTQLSAGANTIQRKCAHCEEEEKKNKIQRKEKSAGEVNAVNGLSTYVNNLGNSGQPLSKEERNFFEPRFSYDFSKVRIHNDASATNSATSINAQAYTYGNNIVFNNGKYSPGTNSGKKLLGHELTHVVQQGKGVSRKIQRSPGSPAGGCGVCYGSPKFAGIAAHTLIQEGLQAFFGKNIVQAETLVPSPGDESGRLDIAIPSKTLGTIMIAEIKPNNPNGKAQGIKDIKHYSKQLRGLRMKVITLDWIPKIPVIPFPTLGSGPSCPSFQSLNISAEPSAPGVILYECNPDFKDLIKKCKCNPFKKGDKKEGEKEKTSEKEKANEKEKPTEKEKPAEKEKPTEKEKPKEKGKAGGSAGNFGFGISILSSSAGGGNAGVGISILSDGVSVGTISGGVVFNSQGVAIASASGGISTDSTGAGAGNAALGKSDGNTGANAGTATLGSSKGNTAANAGVAAKGNTEGQTATQAGKKGDASSKDQAGGDGNDAQTKAAIEQGNKIAEALKKATPEQKKLLEKMSQKKGGDYEVPDDAWVDEFLQSTKDIKESDIDAIANSTGGDAKTDLPKIKQTAKQSGSGKGDGSDKSADAGAQANKTDDKDAGASKDKTGGGAGTTTADKYKGLNDTSRKKISEAPAPVSALFKSFADGQKDDLKLTDDTVNKFFEIVPSDLTQEEADKLSAGMTSSAGKSPDEVISEMKKSIEAIRKGKTPGANDKATSGKAENKPTEDDAKPDMDYGRQMAERILNKKDWANVKGFEVVRRGDKSISESKLNEEFSATLYQRYKFTGGTNAGEYITATTIVVKVIATSPLQVEVLSSKEVVFMKKSVLTDKGDVNFQVSTYTIPRGTKFTHGK